MTQDFVELHDAADVFAAWPARSNSEPIAPLLVDWAPAGEAGTDVDAGQGDSLPLSLRRDVLSVLSDDLVHPFESADGVVHGFLLGFLRSAETFVEVRAANAGWVLCLSTRPRRQSGRQDGCRQRRAVL